MKNIDGNGWDGIKESCAVLGGGCPEYSTLHGPQLHSLRADVVSFSFV